MNKSIGDKVIEKLRVSGFEVEALEIEKWLKYLASDSLTERNEGVFQIQGLCQMRAYGDLKIEGINGWVWNSMLEKLKKYAAKKSYKIKK